MIHTEHNINRLINNLEAKLKNSLMNECQQVNSWELLIAEGEFCVACSPNVLTACHCVVPSTQQPRGTLQGAEPAAGSSIIFSAHWPHFNVSGRQKDEVTVVDWLPVVTGMKDLFCGDARRCYRSVIVLRAAIHATYQLNL